MKEGKDEILLDLRIGKLKFSSDSKSVQFQNYEEGEVENTKKLRVNDQKEILKSVIHTDPVTKERKIIKAEKLINSGALS